MTDKIIPINDHVNKKDLELILEVNKKAIEIETEVATQNEEIIDLLTANKERSEKMDEKLDKLVKQSDDTTKDLFRIQVLFITGLLSLVIQIIQIFEEVKLVLQYNNINSFWLTTFINAESKRYFLVLIESLEPFTCDVREVDE